MPLKDTAVDRLSMHVPSPIPPERRMLMTSKASRKTHTVAIKGKFVPPTTPVDKRIDDVATNFPCGKTLRPV